MKDIRLGIVNCKVFLHLCKMYIDLQMTSMLHILMSMVYSILFHLYIRKIHMVECMLH